MNAQRSLAIVLTLALIVAALPAMAAPGDAAPVSSGTPLRSSIDRALQATPSRIHAASGGARATQASGTSGGGGGGHTAMVLLGLAVSAASTYLVIKQVNKTSEQVPPPAMTFGVTIRR